MAAVAVDHRKVEYVQLLDGGEFEVDDVVVDPATHSVWGYSAVLHDGVRVVYPLSAVRFIAYAADG